MSFTQFLDSLDELNNGITATQESKTEAYEILVEHNEKAEQEFIERLKKRKESKQP